MQARVGMWDSHKYHVGQVQMVDSFVEHGVLTNQRCERVIIEHATFLVALVLPTRPHCVCDRSFKALGEETVSRRGGHNNPPKKLG